MRYEKKYVVISNTTGIPLSNQPYYTLQQAVDRVGREEREMARLFPNEDIAEIRKLFGVVDTKTGEQVV